MLAPVTTDLAVRARYAQGAGIYRILPAAVARPHDLPALRAALAAALAAGWPVTPRGAGSAMGGGNLGPGLVLDLTALDAGRCTLDPTLRRATVSPALTLPALDAAAQHYGLHLPLDPSSARWATIGGLIGTNAAGARTVRDGPMRPWVQGVTLETWEGPLRLERGSEPDPHHPVVQRFARDAAPMLARHRDAILARWPRTRKNTLGYALDAWHAHGDLLDLVIGAEGTLGIVTEATVHLAPMATHHATLRVDLADRRALVAAIAALMPHAPVRLEFLDASFLRVATPDADPPAAVLLADFEADDVDTLRQVIARVSTAVRAGAMDVVGLSEAMDAAAAHALWAVRHGASPRLAALTDGRRSLQVIEDGCVPAHHLSDYLDAVEAACARQRVDVVMFGHAGDGHVHVNLLPDVTGPDWLERVRAIHAEVTEALLHLGGTPAGEHGAGRLRASLVERFLGPEATACFAAIRAAFDPAGRWNPGVITTDGTDPFTRLKVGADAAALPEGVAELLHRREAEARWGEALGW